MGKTVDDLLIPKFTRDHGVAIDRAGWYEGFEYRIRSEDPEFNQTKISCDACKEVHKSPYEGRPPWIHPKRPLEIGENWVKAHHIQSIIETRSTIFEKKIGPKTLSSGTTPNPDSFIPQSEWMPFAFVTKNGKINYVGQKDLPIKKIANPFPEKPTSFETGITFYTTDESDTIVHELIANALGCSTASLINSHYQSSDSHYTYQRSLSIHRDKKTLKWTAMGSRIISPQALIVSIYNRFPGAEHVKIDVVDNVDLA